MRSAYERGYSTFTLVDCTAAFSRQAYVRSDHSTAVAKLSQGCSSQRYRNVWKPCILHSYGRTLNAQEASVKHNYKLFSLPIFAYQLHFATDAEYAADGGTAPSNSIAYVRCSEALRVLETWLVRMQNHESATSQTKSQLCNIITLQHHKPAKSQI
eukprot:SAG11_NODE_4729_length_1789_cov_1.577515_3_plen_156_part_00